MKLELTMLTIGKIKQVPAGRFIVILSKIPDKGALLEENAMPLRQNWKEYYIYKRLSSAQKRFNKIRSTFWSDFLKENNLINYN